MVKLSYYSKILVSNYFYDLNIIFVLTGEIDFMIWNFYCVQMSLKWSNLFLLNYATPSFVWFFFFIVNWEVFMCAYMMYVLVKWVVILGIHIYLITSLILNVKLQFVSAININTRRCGMNVNEDIYSASLQSYSLQEDVSTYLDRVEGFIDTYFYITWSLMESCLWHWKSNHIIFLCSCVLWFSQCFILIFNLSTVSSIRESIKTAAKKV